MVRLEVGRGLVMFDGRPMPGAGGEPTVVKDVLLHYLGTFNSKNGKSMLEAYQLGMKMASSKEAVLELENAEFGILKEALQAPVHGALVMGQLQMVMDEAEKTKR